MPIDVTCDECFTPHRVKSEHAGRRFKCRECGASLLVPKKGQAATPEMAPPPASGRPSSSAARSKSKKRRSSAKSRGPSWTKGPLAWIAGGLGVVVLILLFVFPPFLGLLSMPLALAGIAMALWGALKCLASAFEEDVTCGLMWLFVPLYNVFYMFTRWDRVGPYFLTFLAGLFLMWAPLYGLKMVTQAQWAEHNRDPNLEIAELYNDAELDAQIDQFQQSPPPEQTGAENSFAANAPATTPDNTPAAATPQSPPDSGPQARPVPRRRGRQPPPASVLDGRPDPLPSPPRAAEIVIHTSSPAHPGDAVWITDKGWWYPGTVTELTENPFQVMVRFDGWEDRAPVEKNTAHLRHRTQMSDEILTYKLKLVSVQGPTDQLDQRVDEQFSSNYGYVAGSAHVDLENYVITYQAHRGSDLDETLRATSTLTSLEIDSRGIGIVKRISPRGEMMIGQVHYKDYRGDIPLQQFADRALRGYRQYVPGSAQVDEQAGVIRFVFDASVVEESFFDHTSLDQLFAALGYTADTFGQLSNPQATPYKKTD